jgi:hypothetical protein
MVTSGAFGLRRNGSSGLVSNSLKSVRAARRMAVSPAGESSPASRASQASMSSWRARLSAATSSSCASGVAVGVPVGVAVGRSC